MQRLLYIIFFWKQNHAEHRMFPRVTASNLPRFYDQPVSSFMALQSDFCPDITPPEIMMSEGLRFSSFKHLWSKKLHLFHLFFGAGLSLFAFPSFNKWWWWWCRVDGDTVNRKKTYFVCAGKKRGEEEICCLTSNPSFSKPPWLQVNLHRRWRLCIYIERPWQVYQPCLGNLGDWPVVWQV